MSGNWSSHLFSAMSGYISRHLFSVMSGYISSHLFSVMSGNISSHLFSVMSGNISSHLFSVISSSSMRNVPEYNTIIDEYIYQLSGILLIFFLSVIFMKYHWWNTIDEIPLMKYHWWNTIGMHNTLFCVFGTTDLCVKLKTNIIVNS